MNDFRCSRYLWFLTLFMVGFPVFYLIFSAFIFDLHSKGILSIVLSPLFYLASIFWIMSGVGIRQMRQWSWYTFGAAQFFITYLNALILVQYSDSQTKGLSFILTLLIQGIVFITVEKEIRVPFLFPKIRWWESGIAGMHHVVVEITHSRSPTGISTGQLLDVSSKGCFIKSPIDFQPFERIQVKVQCYGQEVILSGVIVWNAKSTVTHPKGIGVRFYDLDRNTKRKVKVISKRFSNEKDKKNEPVELPA